MNGLALCAGIGGLELGLRLAIGPDYRTVCYIENDPAKVGFLATRLGDGLDDAPIWDDIHTFDAMPWRGLVDIISGGLPCRPYSSASRGRTVAEPIWAAALRIIKVSRPRWVFFENVPQARRDLPMVRNALMVLDYCVLPPLEITAASVGAPFVGRRIFFLAKANEEGESTLTFDDEMAWKSDARSDWWDEIDRVRDMDDGIPGPMAEVGALGDAVVPMVAAHAWRTLVKAMEGEP